MEQKKLARKSNYHCRLLCNNFRVLFVILKNTIVRVFLLVIVMLPFFVARAQHKESIEFSSTIRYDRHGKYISNFAGRAYNDTTSLSGMSYGASIQYRREFFKDLSAYIGIGFYRLGIDKVRGNIPFGIPGIRTARNIDYDDGTTNLLYSTGKYHYNNLVLTLGLTKSFPIRKTLLLEVGAEGLGYYSYSQRYNLNDGYRIYFARNSKKMEFGANTTLGILKEFDKFYVRPALIVPIYQNLKGDEVFYEKKEMSINKWFQGVGLSIRAGKYFY
jgi:hypothetical protein